MGFRVYITLLFLPLLACGYWEMGHMLVAQVCYEGLTAEQKTRVNLFAESDELFGYAPNFVESAVWADYLKKIGLNAFDEWHYIDIPFVLDGVTVPPHLHPGDENLVWALQEMLGTFKSKSAVDGSRAFGIRMLLHFVGDITQPMHSVSLFSNQFPEGDLGGNKFQVIYNGMTTNLHSFFDSGCFRYNLTFSQPMKPTEEQLLLDAAHEIMAKYPKTSFQDSDFLFDPATWSQISHSNAIAFGYLNGTLQPGSVLSEDYVKNAFEMTQRNIALGAYRMQYLIQKYDSIAAPIASFGPSWIAIVAVSTCSAFIIGFSAGALALYIWHKRKKRVRYLSSLEHDSDTDLLVGDSANF